LSGDVESNPGPPNEYCRSVPFLLPTNSVCLIEFRLSQLADGGGSGDCSFRAVSHQLYGNLKGHFHVHNVGIQYFVNHLEQFVEGNTG